eukprot:81641-Chlamydomonas_euryale.AAC.6
MAWDWQRLWAWELWVVKAAWLLAISVGFLHLFRHRSSKQQTQQKQQKQQTAVGFAVSDHTHAATRRSAAAGAEARKHGSNVKGCFDGKCGCAAQPLAAAAAAIAGPLAADSSGQPEGCCGSAGSADGPSCCEATKASLLRATDLGLAHIHAQLYACMHLHARASACACACMSTCRHGIAQCAQ